MISEQWLKIIQKLSVYGKRENVDQKTKQQEATYAIKILVDTKRS